MTARLRVDPDRVDPLSRPLRRYVAASVIIFATLFASPDRAVADTDELRAAFLYQFAKHTTWPEDALDATSESICIAVIDAPGLEETLKSKIRGKRLHDREIRIVSALDPEQAACPIVYFGQETERANKLAETPEYVLTVGGTEDFLERGGIIQLFSADRTLRFNISRAAASRARIQLSSKILRLAKLVVE